MSASKVAAAIREAFKLLHGYARKHTLACVEPRQPTARRCCEMAQ
jgi:hypothetical protein